MNEPRLKVRRGRQVFGPFSVTDLAELLAEGRFGESDEVSPDGRNWMTVDEYVSGEGEESSQAAATSVSADDEFVCIPNPPAVPSPRAEVPHEHTGSTSGPDSDYLLESPASTDDDQDVPLSEDRDPGGPNRRRDEIDDDDDSMYRFTRPKTERLRGNAAADHYYEDEEPIDERQPPRRSRPSYEDEDDDIDASLPDESQLDDVLSALAEDEHQAPQAKLPPRSKRAGSKKSPPGSRKKVKKRPKRR